MILIKILKELNVKEIFPRVEEQVLFILLYEYRSHIKIDFLECINNLEYKWIAHVRLLQSMSLY